MSDETRVILMSDETGVMLTVIQGMFGQLMMMNISESM